ncbi:amino acid ABC transporter substrate-binding protein, PAAT family [Magnetococcus marinus MC-1]|uniref:Amino acid ABC transporter substrate-binding protein, PAAT family n=1 Tax=Magnetococcus marinus (strain ATCC BAA-1437 / JCM 17883 / MC-1) TaxID=156889 RepID=A0LCK3_MAGMM|nr:transporter substrate-binding domain-containing protein [Magnetococcus marinus]ABK45696.1 amino acid ABC transporter substrate-binding protein, PAAT family [Magnetococcus marinus MC-1]
MGLRIYSFLWAMLFLATFGLVTPALARPLDEIMRSGELRLCISGDHLALTNATARTFARYLGVTPHIIHLNSWDQQFHDRDRVTHKFRAYIPALLADGRCDIYPNDIELFAWRMNMLTITPLFATRMTVVVPQSVLQPIRSLQDLGGKRTLVAPTSSAHDWLKQQNQFVFKEHPLIIAFDSTDHSVESLSREEIDFSILSAQEVFRQTQIRLLAIKVAFPVGNIQQVGWGTHPEHHQLRNKLVEFFTLQRVPGSLFDYLWEQHVGIALSAFNLFITSTPGGGEH